MSTPGQTNVAEAKRRLRATARKAREAVAGTGRDAGEAAARGFLGHAFLGHPAIVSVFWPIRGEIDTRPLMVELDARGHRVALPVMIGEKAPLLFRRWQPGDCLVEGPFGTREPASEREELEPGLLIVPMLAFDRKGYRLGYGGGYYDRTLADLRARGGVKAAGLAFSAQEVEEIPREPFDQPLDLVVTEREVIRIGGERPDRELV